VTRIKEQLRQNHTAVHAGGWDACTCERYEGEAGGPKAVEESEPVLAGAGGEHQPNQVAAIGVYSISTGMEEPVFLSRQQLNTY
jgi:hypothetical protein